MSSLLCLSLVFPNQALAQQISPEIHEQNKLKTYLLYFPESTYTLNTFQDHPFLISLMITGLASSTYVSLALKSAGQHIKTAYAHYKLTDHAMFNDLKRLEALIQKRLNNSLDIKTQSQFPQVMLRLDHFFKHVDFQRQHYNQTVFHSSDIGLDRNANKIARIVQAMQYVPMAKMGDFFEGLRKFGYHKWILNTSRASLDFMKTKRLGFDAKVSDSVVENRLNEFYIQTRNQNKIGRRLVRGFVSIVAAFAMTEVILWIRHQEMESTLLETPEDLDLLARTDWPMFEKILDEYPDLAQAGAIIYDQIPAAQKVIQELDVLEKY